MMTIVCLAGALLAASGPTAWAQENAPDARIDASREMVARFSSALKDALTSALNTGGPASAVDVCKAQAPAIAAAMGRNNGWTVGRTSLRTRNGANDPDAWETDGLRSFEARKAAGEDPAKLETWTIVPGQDGQPVFRYMKAIAMQPLCAACHGHDLDPALRAKLDALYPADAATGFANGDIRGAFTIRQPM